MAVILISMSLCAPSRVFVLGAGFSVAAGFPLINGLRKRILDDLEAERHSTYEVFLSPENGGCAKGQFYEGLGSIEKNGSLEFEELLIEIARRLRTASDKDPCHITDRVLRTGCARLLWNIQNQIVRTGSPYQNFAAQLRLRGCDAVISFNWDLLLEKAVSESAIPWAYCAHGPGVPIVKPHGSINWSGHLRRKLVAQYDGWLVLGQGCTLCFDALDPLSNPHKEEVNSDLRYMLYPGDPDLPGKDSDVDWLWQQAEDVIRSRDSLVFIGYSLPDYDTHAAKVFATFKDKSVEVFNPSREHLERFQQIYGAAAVLSAQRFTDCKYSLPV